MAEFKPLKIGTSGVPAQADNTDTAVTGEYIVAKEYETTDPTAPAAGIDFFTRKLAGYNRPAWMEPGGYIAQVGPAQFSAGITIFWPYGGSNTSFNQLIFLNSTTGTATARATATTNYYTQLRKVGAVSSSSAGSTGSFRHTILQVFRGDSAGKGGFFAQFGFAHSDASYVSNSRTFVGMVSTTSALGNADPSTNVNLIGMGYDSTQTTFRIIHNDGSGTATTIDLGANFPSNTVSTDVYYLSLYAPPNSSNVYYHVLRGNTGDEATGTISTDLPSQTTMLTYQVWRNNGSTASAVGIDVCRHIYVEHFNQ